MRKLFLLLVVLTLMLILMPTAALAHTEDDPLVVDLLAGQTEDIGDVLVWNDADYLYVKYVVTSGDCLVETHLHVATLLDEIPQTKKGNPIPGQFAYQTTHGCVADYTYMIPLTWPTDTSLYIAAHAALGQQEAIAIVSGDGQTMVTQRRSGDAGFSGVNAPAVHAWEPGPSYPNDGADDSTWEANSLWDQRLSIDLRPTGADWIWENYRVQDPVVGTVLTFQRNFDIGYPMAGNLKIACDNGYEVFLNGTSLGSDNVYGEWRNSNLKQAFVDVNGWDTVGSFPLLDYLQSGSNSLTIDAANEYFNTDDSGNPSAGTESSNPGACIFVLDVEHLVDGESAWGCGIDNCSDFPGKNWATYFMYTVQEPPCDVDPGLQNGGFEAPPVSNTLRKWDIYDSGTSGLGWTVEWFDGDTSYQGHTRPNPAHLELHRGVNGWLPNGGDQYAELDTDWDGPPPQGGGGYSGEPASVNISQELQTCAGQQYTLKFAYSPRPNHSDNKLDVYWGGTQVNSTYSGSGSSNTNWTAVEANVTASGPTTKLEFVETGTPDSLGMFLDAVSVEKK